MKKMYLAKYLFVKIQEVNVVSETDLFVTLEGENRKEKKQTEYGRYHETYEAAKSDLLSRLHRKRDAKLYDLELLEKEIEKAEQL